MKRRTLLQSGFAAGTGLATMSLVGCGDDDDDDDDGQTPSGDPSPTTAAGESPTNGTGEPTGALRVVHASLGQETFNAHRERATANTVAWYPVYSTLTNTDLDGNSVGEVAESWETPDELTWIWHLKPGVLDHQGNPMDAETVGWNIEHFVEVAVASLTGRFYESFEVMDETTLRVKTSAPFVVGAQHAAGFGEIRLYSRTAFDQMGEDAFYQSPVGTGPFAFGSHSPGLAINYRAFPDYFDGAPGVETLEYAVVPEQSTRLAQLQTGEADLVSAIAGTTVDQLEGDDNIVLKRIEDSSWMVLSPYDRLDADSELHDPRVMAALNYAVDKEGIVEGIFRGRGKPAPYGFFSPITAGYHDDHETWEYDPARARALLDEAGYSDGFEMGDMWVSELAQFPMAPAVIEAINTNLADVGVRSSLRNIDYGAYVEGIRNGDARGLVYLASTNLPDVSLGLPYWVESSSPFAPFPDGPVDAQAAAQATEFDEEARLALLQEIFDIVNKTPLVLFTVSPDVYLPRRANVSDWPQPKATSYIQGVQHITVS